MTKWALDRKGTREQWLAAPVGAPPSLRMQFGRWRYSTKPASRVIVRCLTVIILLGLFLGLAGFPSQPRASVFVPGVVTTAPVRAVSGYVFGAKVQLLRSKNAPRVEYPTVLVTVHELPEQDCGPRTAGNRACNVGAHHEGDFWGKARSGNSHVNVRRLSARNDSHKRVAFSGQEAWPRAQSPEVGKPTTNRCDVSRCVSRIVQSNDELNWSIGYKDVRRNPPQLQLGALRHKQNKQRQESDKSQQDSRYRYRADAAAALGCCLATVSLFDLCTGARWWWLSFFGLCASGYLLLIFLVARTSGGV